MAISIDVALPRDAPPRFPHKCIVCARVPDSTIRITHDAHNLVIHVLFPPSGLLKNWTRMAIPICRSCKPRFLWQRWGLVLWHVAYISILYWLLFPLIRGLNLLLQNFVLCGLAVAILVGYRLTAWRRPPYIDTTTSRRLAIFEFSSAAYALEFFKLNREHVVWSDFDRLIERMKNKSESNPVQ